LILSSHKLERCCQTGAANSMAGSSDNMENVRDIGATSGARYSNATDRQKLGFRWPKPCIRTASLRTGVSVSGKRNFVRRDKGDETSGEVHRDSPAETKLTPQLGQLRASYRTAGKSLRKSECVVDEPVHCEPVSTPNSLLTGKITGKLAKSAPGGCRFGQDVPCRRLLCRNAARV
jgi:hypothetical protein